MAKKLTYESALKRLEEIINIIEDGEIPLDKVLNLYKEGIKLTLFCEETLDKVEGEIFQLQKTSNEVIKKKKFLNNTDEDIL